MSTLDQIKAVLMAPGTPFVAVEGAADMATAIQAGPKAIPCAFVYFGDEVSGENIGGTGPVRQRTERNLSVVFVLDTGFRATGEADELEAVKAWERAALIGRVIEGDPAREAITHVQGGVAEFRDGRVWYEDVFSHPTYTKEANP